MKRNIIAIVLGMTMIATLAACGKAPVEKEAVQIETVEIAPEEAPVEVEPSTADEPVMEAEVPTEPEMEMEGDEGVIGDYPSNGFENRIGQTSFESYDEIIGLLDGEAYALVKVKGYDEEVLLVAELTYEDQDGLATTECTPYTMKSTGSITADSLIVSGGTANPLKMDADGVIYAASHSSVGKYCYGENGTPNKAIMMLSSVYADTFDDNGDPATVSGFVRTQNDLINDDMKQIEENQVDVYNQIFDDYNNAKVITFTKSK